MSQVFGRAGGVHKSDSMSADLRPFLSSQRMTNRATASPLTSGSTDQPARQTTQLTSCPANQTKRKFKFEEWQATHARNITTFWSQVGLPNRRWKWCQITFNRVMNRKDTLAETKTQCFPDLHQRISSSAVPDQNCSRLLSPFSLTNVSLPTFSRKRRWARRSSPSRGRAPHTGLSITRLPEVGGGDEVVAGFSQLNPCSVWPKLISPSWRKTEELALRELRPRRVSIVGLYVYMVL